METIVLKSNIHCSNCVSKIEPVLKEEPGIHQYDISLGNPDSLITLKAEGLKLESVIQKIAQAGYRAELFRPDGVLHVAPAKVEGQGFWKSSRNWKRASFNTLNCLIGCSIGDFAMIIFLQAYYPGTSMMWQMILAIIAGLCTSIALETIILRTREKFDWLLALKTAFSMSFISMVGMEIAMNTTDFMITGGKAAFNSAGYWLALLPALAAGFMFPLPYNYYKLQKFNKSCH